ncbi:hypothetical protein PR202_ga12554 [Eleusine coracana subsp. coracana]|uniref:Disease resistance N-terminal domain-containing protein n=1 Tax=Eleusine coracana subsp. coracana TaxID=191504 RepID=A0AAV5CCE7_ELECO|nr:hypothetical protein PR202_ga12554 [Eleusine coracana subsp. coracana]
MIRIQRTLDESSEHSIRGETDRLRLRELQQFVYDAQDAVDEYKFEQLRRRMEDLDRRGDNSGRSGRKRKGDKKVTFLRPLSD